MQIGCFRTTLALVSGLILLLALLPAAVAGEACHDPAGTTIFLVRHAEKTDDGSNDPPLSTEGQTRAQALREVLNEVPLSAIHTTHLKRTWQTAGPVALAHDLPINRHPIASGQAAEHSVRLADTLIEQHCGEQVLVVGHSNTVPLIVAALTGQAEPELSESDYDFFYQVRAMTDGRTTVTRTRYGHPGRTPYRVGWQGALRDFHHGDVSGKVSLDPLAAWPGLNAVGPAAGLDGEVTVIDGQWYMTRVRNGKMLTEHEATGEAGFLVWSHVDEWQKPVMLDMTVGSQRELELIVDLLARDNGLDVERPFPFLMTGTISSLNMHVLDASNESDSGHLDGALKVSRENESVILLGFFSRKHAGVFTHRGSWIHLHALLADGHAGHVDRIGLDSPVKLVFPAHRGD